MTDSYKPADVVGSITGLEVEAVVGGALQRITFQAGTNPAEVAAMLRSLDPGATVRTEFPSRGSFGGNRETKAARVLMIQAEAKGDAKFVKMVGCTTAGEELTVIVGKKKADEWLPAVEALGKLSDKNLEKLRTAMAGGKSATVILPDEEHFGCLYWTTSDGTAFYESLQAQPPGEAA